MHPAVWLCWALAVMAFALMTTNPLYLVVLLLAILFVAVLAPRTGSSVAGFRAMALAGVAIVLMSLLAATINGGYGAHTLLTAPGPDLPSWMGGLRLGGPVTAEALIAALIRGLAILCVFLGFAVFNGAVSPHRVLRLGPAPLFHAGLVVTIGLTLLPAIVEDFRRIREMRALRGARSGLRALPGIFVPAIIGGLDRALRFAEAMESRGYASSAPVAPLARIAGLAAAAAALAAGWMWLFTRELQVVALAGFALSGALLAYWAIASAHAHHVTRMTPEPFPWRDRVVVVLLLGSVSLTLASRSVGWVELAYNPFARLDAPAFDLGALVLLAPMLAPAILSLGAPFPAQSLAPGEEQGAAAGVLQ